MLLEARPHLTSQSVTQSGRVLLASIRVEKELREEGVSDATVLICLGTDKQSEVKIFAIQDRLCDLVDRIVTVFVLVMPYNL